jgi:ABC-2 type transport system permease protein
MIAALFYLQYHSARNRLVTRFKRLQQPKYLIGAIAGGLYFYFYFIRYLFLGHAGGRSSAGSLAVSPEHSWLMEPLAALLLFIIVLLAWLIPHERAALTFTEAEVAFLFPAPVSRRTLIHFKLLRSQLRILFSALFFTLLSHRFGGNIWIHAAGWWLALSTLNLHFLGSSFTRTLLLDYGISNWLRRLTVFVLAAAAVGGVWLWAKNTLPAPDHFDATDINSILDYLGKVLTAGPALYLLYPFRLLVRPFFASNASVFFAVLAPAVLLFLLHYLWVIFSDVAFEEASLAASQKMAIRVAAVRAGNWVGAGKNLKARRAWFKLAPTGPAFMALLWKNLLGMGRGFPMRLWIMIAVVLVVFVISFSSGSHGQNSSGGHGQNLTFMAAIILAILLGYSLLLGPQFLRLDFRRDLPQADILKTFPMRGWQIALGEILAPVAVLTGFQWLLLLPTTVFTFYLPGNNQTLFLMIALSAVFVLPILDFILLLIPNAAVLLFPSWVQAGKDSPRGIEATGQRLVFAVGQLLILLLALLPAGLAFTGVYFLFKLMFGPVLPVFFAALAGSVILAVEASLGVLLLGKLFERFDVTE